MRRCKLLIAGALASCLATRHQSATAQTSVAPPPPMSQTGASTAVFAQPVPSISITAHGASPAASASTNMAAINAAIAASITAGHKTVWVPPGAYNYNSMIRLNNGAKLVGAGITSILNGTDPTNRAVDLRGDGGQMKQLKMTVNGTGSRTASSPHTIAFMESGTNSLIENVLGEGGDAAGIVCGGTGSSGHTIRNNTIRNTLADSIHITNGCHHLLVEKNLIENSGDDGIAVVSYQSDGTRVNNITARNNVVRGNKWGRNMSVVGGSQILYENNLLQNNPSWACLYIAQEDSYKTYSALNVKAHRNTFQNCGSLKTGHAAAMVFSDGTEANNSITLLSNDIIQNGQDGIRYFGPQTNIRLDQNRISGARRAYVGGAVPGVTVIPYAGGSVGYVSQ